MPPRTIALPKGVPSKLTFNGLVFRIFATSQGMIGFRHKVGSKWRQVLRRNLDDLRRDAERIGLSILNAETASLDMTAEERRIYIASRDALEPHGAAVDAVARDAAEAFAIAGRVSLAELAKYWIANKPQQMPTPPTASIITELLASLADKGRSRVYRDRLKADLERFAAKHPDLTTCSESAVADYLREFLAGGRSQRRRDNVRDSIVRMFRFARAKQWLSPDRTTAAERVERIAPGVDEVSTFSAAEIHLLLEHASPAWLPFFAIGAFAGLRNSELLRLEWSALKWDAGVIAVKSSIARKIRISRHAPLLPNLADWLSDYRDQVGPVVRHKSEGAALSALSRELRKMEKRMGFAWKENALRHSFGSYRLAVLKNPAQLALEMGNSPAQIREHYHDPKSEGEAAAYFARRDNNAKVLHLPLTFHGKG